MSKLYEAVRVADFTAVLDLITETVLPEDKLPEIQKAGFRLAWTEDNVLYAYERVVDFGKLGVAAVMIWSEYRGRKVIEVWDLGLS